MAWDAGSITSASPWAALSQKLKDLISGGSGVGNWSFVENVPAGTGAGQSGATTYSLDVFRCRGATTLYDRVVQKNLANIASTTDGTSFIHAITTPPASRFITVLVFNTKASAAEDPTSVTLDGTNAPTFTKIKSQASGDGSTGLKLTLWIGKSSGSAPTGTNLTVAFAGTQTGCGVIVDEWQGPDLTLGADGVDGTGATKIGIQVVGASGTTELGQSATLAAMLGAGSNGVTWAGATGGSVGAYTPEAGWVGLATDLTYATPSTHARGAWRPYQDDLTGLMTNAAAAAGWAVISFEFQAHVNASSITNANDAGKDWYFIIEIPVPDGAVNSSMNCAEDYNGFRLFNRMPPTPAGTAPVGTGGWRSDTLAQYASVTGNNRASLIHQVLNTTGFSYWIKLTPNAVIISTRVSAAEAMNGAMLLDSFVTNATDLPLIGVSSITAGGNSMSRLPGITGVSITPGTGWECETYPWTTPTRQGIGTNAASAQDLWSSNKIHVARVFVGHSAGNTAANAFLYGYAKGLWKTDFLCFTRGGTVQLGDTMTIAGNTWTVINTSAILLGTGQALIIVARAT